MSERHCESIRVGLVVEIKPAYSSLTGERSEWDEIAGCQATILSVRDNDTVDVQIKNGDEHNVHIARLKL